jgi:hypothetical protein
VLPSSILLIGGTILELGCLFRTSRQQTDYIHESILSSVIKYIFQQSDVNIPADVLYIYIYTNFLHIYSSQRTDMIIQIVYITAIRYNHPTDTLHQSDIAIKKKRRGVDQHI